MAALLVALAVMSLMLSMALPVWHHAAQREREAELIFRGEQYARAIMLYQRQTPGAYPPAVEPLVEGRFLRRAYRDPMTTGGEFRLILQSELAEFSGLGATGGAADDGEPEEARDGPRRQRQGEDVRNRPGFMQGVRPFANRGERTPGGVDGNIAGVVSRSEETSIALYNGQSRYSDWVFLGEGPAAGQAGGESGQPEPGLSDPFGGRSGSGAGARMGGLEQLAAVQTARLPFPLIDLEPDVAAPALARGFPRSCCFVLRVRDRPGWGGAPTRQLPARLKPDATRRRLPRHRRRLLFQNI